MPNITANDIGKTFKKGKSLRTIVGRNLAMVYYKTPTDFKKGMTHGACHELMNKWLVGAEEVGKEDSK